MNSLGGDNFWLIDDGRNPPIGIDACGAAAAGAGASYYRDRGLTEIPPRGALATLTVAGAVGGWQRALEMARRWGGEMPLPRLLEDAIYHARAGTPVSATLHNNLASKFNEVSNCPGFRETFLFDGKVPMVGELLKLPALAQTFDHLAARGLDDFYRGEVGQQIADDLTRVGSLLTATDLARYRALIVKPLSLSLSCGEIFNMPPPTQGLASLVLLGIFDRICPWSADGSDFVHAIVEATKLAFQIRDECITDPACMTIDPQQYLDASELGRLAQMIDAHRALSWPLEAQKGDTVWLGAIDTMGRAVSFIQSIYWEFGSGVVLPNSGIVWQNRGASFSLDEKNLNFLRPGRRPFHTIQPAFARLKDGRRVVYGTMGGDGQPQTQAAILSRVAYYGQEPQEAVSAPRWLLGRTWGSQTTNLRIENRFPIEVVDSLRGRGHDVMTVGPFDEVMGHAGMIVRGTESVLEGAADPRGDGRAAGF